MRYNSFEVNYLISLISSTLNKRIPPNPIRFTQWRDLFYLAEYHNITNIAYYSLIGVYDQIPEVWKNRFAKVFRKWVTISSIQEKEISALREALEDEAIDYMILMDWEMKRYYPQSDVRAVDDIGILIRTGHGRDVKRLMSRLEYHHETGDENGTMVYHKSTRFQVVFYQKLFTDNRRLSPYYSKIWKKLKSAVGYGSRYALGVDDFYIYMMTNICNTYAKGETDARHILDIFQYIKKNKDEMNRTYIDMELGKLELAKMAKCLENVGALWIGVYEGDETRQCRDVEEYIWSKGAYGRETSRQLLPMIDEMEIWQIRDRRKKKMTKTLRWFFPKAEQMRGRYPVVARAKALLPVFWMARLISLLGFLIKIRYGAVRRFLTLKLHEMMMHGRDTVIEPLEDKTPLVKEEPLVLTEELVAAVKEPVAPVKKTVAVEETINGTIAKTEEIPPLSQSTTL